MPAAIRSNTPETATNSVIAYTLMVQHGSRGFDSPTNDNTTPSTDPASISDFFVLARVTTFTPTQSRTITRVYEINNYSGGRAVELIPGGISDDSVSVARIETYQQSILEAFDPVFHSTVKQDGSFLTRNNTIENGEGRGGIDNLTFQKRPFLLLRLLFFPNMMSGGFGESADVNGRMDLYCNCYFEHIDRSIDVSGGAGGLVTANGTIQVTKRRSRYLKLEDSQALQSSLLQSPEPGIFGAPASTTRHPQLNPNNIGYQGVISDGIQKSRVGL